MNEIGQKGEKNHIDRQAKWLNIKSQLAKEGKV